MKIFEGYSIKNLNLKNRIVMPPMCMYSADDSGETKGHVNDFHMTHYISRAVGAVGLIIVEATAVTPNGRISSNDLGIWSDAHVEGLKRLVDGVKRYDTPIGIQISHAGRKCQSDDEYIVAPSPIQHSKDYRTPRELSKDDIRVIIHEFKEAARRAYKAGFDTIEIHGAHGYLISEFLSPLSNKREDEYGGSTENRTRFLKEVLEAVREVWPEDKAILLRVSAYDYLEDGMDKVEMSKIINLVKDYIDIVHVSSGGVAKLPGKIYTYPGYQLNYAQYIKSETNMPTIAVGLIDNHELVEEILSNDRADLVAIGRGILRDPYYVLNTAYKLGIEDVYPRQYERGYFQNK